jgi:hypothetical protein
MCHRATAAGIVHSFDYALDEFRLMEFLLEKPGRVYARGESARKRAGYS